MTVFDASVLNRDRSDRTRLLGWLEAALEAVNPETLTFEGLAGSPAQTSVIAIGKAAPAMCRGAARAAQGSEGICISDHTEVIPKEYTLILGDHPIPGPASNRAGKSALSFVAGADPDLPLIALISGGGSALCDAPREGVTAAFVERANDALIHGGADIEEINTVRGLLSSVKCGGLTAAAGRPIDTYVLSDVAGADPGIVASGPTVPSEPSPEAALEVLDRIGFNVPSDVKDVMNTPRPPLPYPNVTLLADGHDAAQAIARTADIDVEVRSEWLTGDIESCVDEFLKHSTASVTVVVGEPVVEVSATGRGGRNTHAALLAARRIGGTEMMFAAYATDGVDGSSMSAGGLVDGHTIERGGDPSQALACFDSATYLEASGDLLVSGPTGTNVSDIWILWRRNGSGDLEL
jgi:hydroxypyruvate reductase